MFVYNVHYCPTVTGMWLRVVIICNKNACKKCMHNDIKVNWSCLEILLSDVGIGIWTNFLGGGAETSLPQKYFDSARNNSSSNLTKYNEPKLFTL